MSKEAAAAMLTQIYFSALESERDRLTGRSSHEPYAMKSLEAIGTVYGTFVTKLPDFEERGKQRTK